MFNYSLVELIKVFFGSKSSNTLIHHEFKVKRFLYLGVGCSYIAFKFDKTELNLREGVYSGALNCIVLCVPLVRL